MAPYHDEKMPQVAAGCQRIIENTANFLGVDGPERWLETNTDCTNISDVAKCSHC